VKVGIKYCGGCNPRYHRALVVRRLREDFPDVDVVRADSLDVDVVAVVCGCPVACASHAELKGRLGKVVLTQEADFERLGRLLSVSRAREEGHGLDNGV
jgi:4-hydroxybutyrate CoA-transferase